ncbi:phosphoglycerate mutase [Microthyrium microscopicum]|uniref:Phosphoglycerate mutase n=1 Tax=Microthyrium microscopicum TaxID=703497 RepID=A0A6A6U5A1_9PEZI|nr:phosphoglycerate mutase [Microthyrium microscopicum]
MADQVTPRLFIIRHGETEWSLNGRHTGSTDIPLTANGEKRVIATGKALVGKDRMIVPGDLAHIYVSPRKRAQRTLELLGIGCREKFPWHDSHNGAEVRTDASIEITEAVREWDYGGYEGKTSAQIRVERNEKGLSENWDIWSQGCPGGESPQQVEERLDKLIAEIRAKWHAPVMGKDRKGCGPGDVLVVAHGHIGRAFVARWVGKNIMENPSLILEAGGVGCLSYEHHNIKEPAIVLGAAFTVPQ